MKFFKVCFLLLLSFSSSLYSQIEERKEAAKRNLDSIPIVVDSLYREDQFYVGFSFNVLTNKAAAISNSGFSGGIHVGAMRDFPLNKRRNVAIAAGLGWSLNSYGQNLFIGETPGGETIFRSLDGRIDYDKNRFTTQLVEVPLEFRWRTSTPTSYKFWRIYTGFRLGYIYYFRSRFVQGDHIVRQTKLPELERLRLGTTFTFGFNTFNFQFYYSLNSLFKNAEVEGSEIGAFPLKIGLTFYIL